MIRKEEKEWNVKPKRGYGGKRWEGKDGAIKGTCRTRMGDDYAEEGMGAG